MKNAQKHLQIMTTEDGSITVKNLNYNEACHSSSGAREETLLHYVKGCKVDTLLEQKSIIIFEMGFGTGLGFLTTKEFLESHNFKGKLIFHSIEKDLPTIEFAMSQYADDLRLQKYEDHMAMVTDNIELKVYFNDAKAIISSFQRNFYDCLYQDAFSPRRNPELWTVEWFTNLKDIAKKTAIMSTYSASSSIRKSMIQAGWRLSAGEKFGTKRTSTRAQLIGETQAEILDKLKRSPVNPIYDKDIETYKKDI